MDPQATLDAILDAIATNNREQFDEAFNDLANWLQRGGYPPTCKGLGMASYRTTSGHSMPHKPRQTITATNGLYSIQTIRADDLTAYEFVIWSPKGELVARYPLGK